MTDMKPSLLAHHFSEFIAGRAELVGEERNQIYEIVLRLSASLEGGHNCIAIGSEELQFLNKVPLVTISDGTVFDTRTPLVICNSKLYLQRYYQYETRLAHQLSTMARSPEGYLVDKETESGEIEDELERLFPAESDGNSAPDIDYQKEAARLALKKRLTIISGGPGTGKTSTVVKILALIIRVAQSVPKIGLAAPTGKAAMRLSESIGKSLLQLDLPLEISGAIPTSASTLHRLLGVRHNSPKFQHHHDNPMVWDVVVVDEASMVDLALMSKLVDGLKEGAQLILLGDKDQLASVESGAVLADLIASLPKCSIELRKSYRFDQNIKELASSVNRADTKTAWELLENDNLTNIGLLGEEMIEYIAKSYANYMELVAEAMGRVLDEQIVTKIFFCFQSFQLLCAVRFGERGVIAMNRRVELTLAARGYLCRPEQWYVGRPVLITRNDYGLDLYNGDIGICLANSSGDGVDVWFQKSDGSFKSYHPNRLPPCETVFAMTIHKSQGSEFGEVVVVLPEEDSRILSRELVYTAITRAKESVRVVAGKQVLSLAIQKNVDRQSGLRGLFDNKINETTKS